jgi:hypothetical protein
MFNWLWNRKSIFEVYFLSLFYSVQYTVYCVQDKFISSQSNITFYILCSNQLIVILVGNILWII